MTGQITQTIFEQARKGTKFPKSYFPVWTESLLIDSAEGTELCGEYGIGGETLLFCDRTKEFTDGSLSLFVNRESGRKKISRHAAPGYRYAGALMATLKL